MKVIAYYCLTPLADPHAEVALQKSFLETRDVTSRIYISEQGINGQMSASPQAAQEYIDWMHSRAPFADITFKIQAFPEHVFPRLTIKYRKELVAVGVDVDLSKRGEHVSPERWKTMLDDAQRPLLLDVRNDYEWKVGRFDGAELPPLEAFRNFPAYANSLKEKVDAKDTPVMMYCTGGIRCEIFSSILMNAGFEKVYQLDGGVINYGEKVGNDHWLGKLFVFDDRLTIPIAEEECPVIGTCFPCGTPAESYYNCANMDCNALFLCCPTCLKQLTGCCCTECESAPRRRPYAEQEAHKPFRRWYQYAKKKEDLVHLSKPKT